MARNSHAAAVPACPLLGDGQTLLRRPQAAQVRQIQVSRGEEMVLPLHLYGLAAVFWRVGLVGGLARIKLLAAGLGGEREDN